MQNLTVIENELVPIYELSDVDAIENEDFKAAQICAPSGQTKKDHIIKLDTPKEIMRLLVFRKRLMRNA